MEHNTLESLESLFLSLSDKTRLRLLGLMSNDEVSVGFLADSLGQSQPKVSRHLAYLRNTGLVSTRRDGKWIYYAIQPPADPDVRQVLFDTLATLSRMPYEAEPNRPHIVQPVVRETIEIETYDDAVGIESAASDDSDLEMEVHLL